VTRRALDELKQQIPLLEYLQAHDWQQARPIGFGRFLGLCPLHADLPSQGGDVPDLHSLNPFFLTPGRFVQL
jgi:hypothetical protein